MAWFSDGPGHLQPRTLSPFRGRERERVLGQEPPGPSENQANFWVALSLTIKARPGVQPFKTSENEFNFHVNEIYFLYEILTLRERLNIIWKWPIIHDITWLIDKSTYLCIYFEINLCVIYLFIDSDKTFQLPIIPV